MKIVTVKGPWVSFGIHVDFQRWFIDIHLIWWIITIGNSYEQPPEQVSVLTKIAPYVSQYTGWLIDKYPDGDIDVRISFWKDGSCSVKVMGDRREMSVFFANVEEMISYFVNKEYEERGYYE